MYTNPAAVLGVSFGAGGGLALTGIGVARSPRGQQLGVRGHRCPRGDRAPAAAERGVPYVQSKRSTARAQGLIFRLEVTPTVALEGDLNNLEARLGRAFRLDYGEREH